MKKRNILLSLLLVLTMMFTACGSGDPFEGKWIGTLDVTKQFNDGIIEHFPGLAEYAAFEDLVFVIDIEFADGMMTMSVDQDSIDAFNENFEAGMEILARGAVIVEAESTGLTLEEAVLESGLSEEEYIEARLAEMEMEKMKEAMQNVTNESVAAISSINGPYTYNTDDVNLRYEDDYYEAIEYEFEGNQLILTFRGESYSLRVECEKQ